jgi:hypothetical protein
MENKFKSADSKTLAAQIVLFKTLGVGKENAVKCMEELSFRRTNGDDFQFENWIEEEVKKVPKTTNSNFSSMLKLENLMKMVKK